MKQKILFLPNNVSGVNFWRMFQFWKKMVEKGLNAHIHRYETNNSTLPEWEFTFHQNEKYREELYQALLNADVTVIGYAHGQSLVCLTEMFLGLGKKIFCEIDDDISSVPIYNPAYRQGIRPGTHYEKTAMEHMRMSSGVITSTEFLKDQYDRFNKNVNCIPNCIDFDVWKPRKHTGKTLTVGWIGGGNHDEDLRLMLDVIPKILDKHNNIEFKFVHGIPSYLRDFNPRVKYTLDWVSIDKYPSFVASQGFDIGIAPLEYNKFNMSKSNLRWLEYSAIGIPTVATNIEPYSRSIEHGKTGYLADSNSEWVDCLSELIESDKKRKEIGENARQSVFENFNLDTVTDKYINVLRRN